MLTPAESRELLRIELELKRRRTQRRLFSYAPYPKQLEFHAAGSTDRERLLMAGNQLGKELRVDEPVLTPFGWKPIGTLSTGDLVIAGDGSITRVSGVYPQGIKPLIEVEFVDGQTVIAGHDHLWRTLAPSRRFRTRSVSLPRVKGQRRASQSAENSLFDQWQVLTTAHLRRAYGDNPAPKYRHATPAPGAVLFPPVPVPLDPYFLGALIGDGGLTKGIVFSSGDVSLQEMFADQVRSMGGYVKQANRCDFIATACPDLRASLRSLGLFGKGSAEKFVPDLYLWNDKETRLAVLQGLMDTDGTCEKSGITSFTTISRQLADNVVFLVRSLGGRCKVKSRRPSYTHKGEKRTGRLAYTVTIRCPQVNLFRLDRKASRYVRPTSTTDHNLIVGFRDVEPAHAVCISVDHPSKTFVTRDFIVTHNTWSMGFEMAMHLTGRYPEAGQILYPDTPEMRSHGLAGEDAYPNGWPGLRFDRPIWAWAGSVSGEATRDNPQRILIGPPAIKEEWGTGAIPYDDLMVKGNGTQMDYALKNAPSDSLDHVLVRHVSGSNSILQFKTYEQGREKWQGPTLDIVWFDEEPPLDIYMEGLTRTNRTQGPVALTFTPLLGMSEVVRLFISMDDDLTDDEHAA